jgi:hypothetical protein
MSSSRHWWLNQDTHSRVANSTASFVFLGARLCDGNQPEADTQTNELKDRFWRAPCKGGAFPVGASPTRQPLQPEATGATMEVTKWLKPSVKRVTKYGDSARVQAVT